MLRPGIAIRYTDTPPSLFSPFFWVLSCVFVRILPKGNCVAEAFLIHRGAIGVNGLDIWKNEVFLA